MGFPCSSVDAHWQPFLFQATVSSKVRNREQLVFLKKKKNVIRIFELQGPVFFGSADHMVRIVEEKMHSAIYCIKDLRQVTEIDSTGVMILTQLYKRMQKNDKLLIISHMHSKHTLWDFLSISGLIEEVSPTHFFQNTDLALEWAEDQLLSKEGIGNSCRMYALSDLDLFNGFTRQELSIMETMLFREIFPKGSRIINENDVGRDLYVLTRGLVRVAINLPFSKNEKRLSSFCSGVVFGEKSFLDGETRSAEVQAEEDSEVYRLSFENFNGLFVSHPQIAAKVLKNIAMGLSFQLRARSNELRVLAD